MHLIRWTVYTLISGPSLLAVAVALSGVSALVLWMWLVRRPGTPPDARDLLAGLALSDLLLRPVVLTLVGGYSSILTMYGASQPAVNSGLSAIFTEPASLKAAGFLAAVTTMIVLLRGTRLPEQLFPLRGKWLRWFLAGGSLLLLGWAGDGFLGAAAHTDSAVREIWLPSRPDWVANGASAVVALIAGVPIATVGLWRLWRLLAEGVRGGAPPRAARGALAAT